MDDVFSQTTGSFAGHEGIAPPAAWAKAGALEAANAAANANARRLRMGLPSEECDATHLNVPGRRVVALCPSVEAVACETKPLRRGSFRGMEWERFGDSFACAPGRRAAEGLRQDGVRAIGS